jgi:hypothetical protein
MNRKRSKPKIDRKMPMVHPNAAAIDEDGADDPQTSRTSDVGDDVVELEIHIVEGAA